MTIKDKLQTIKRTNEYTMSIKYCSIYWTINNDDMFYIYQNENDYKENKSLVSCKFKDIQFINQSYLNLDFDSFHLEKRNPVLNILSICFILHSDLKIEHGINTRIKYI